MITEVKMFTVICDNCETNAHEDSEFSCWNDEEAAVQDAKDSDWIEENHNHYCPDCYSYNDDDELEINLSRKKGGNIK